MEHKFQQPLSYRPLYSKQIDTRDETSEHCRGGDNSTRFLNFHPHLTPSPHPHPPPSEMLLLWSWCAVAGICFDTSGDGSRK